MTHRWRGFLTALLAFVMLHAMTWLMSASWKYLIASVAMVWLATFFQRRHGLNFGLPNNAKVWLRALGAFFISSILSIGVLWLLTIVGMKGLFRFSPELLLTVPFQTLNEELLFRGLLFLTLVNFGLGGRLLNLGLGLLFVVSHVAHYAFAEGVVLTVWAQLTLLFFVLATNVVTLETRSLAPAWAAHAGWNMARYSFVYSSPSGVGFATEGESFNVLEGMPLVTALTCAIAFFVVGYIKIAKKPLGQTR